MPATKCTLSCLISLSICWRPTSGLFWVSATTYLGGQAADLPAKMIHGELEAFFLDLAEDTAAAGKATEETDTDFLVLGDGRRAGQRLKHQRSEGSKSQ